MNPLADRVVFAASTAVGLREEGGPNCGPPVELYAGGREEPWCAHFVATLFREENAPLPGDVAPGSKTPNPIALCSMMWAEAVRAGLAVEKPQKGDVMILNHRGSSDPDSTGWHCGIVSAVSGKLVQTIEGNRGDRVERGVYRIDNAHIVGFFRPREP